MTLNRDCIIQTALNMFTKLAEIISATCMRIMSVARTARTPVDVVRGHIGGDRERGDTHAHTQTCRHMYNPRALKPVSMHVISRARARTSDACLRNW